MFENFAAKELKAFVKENMEKYFQLVQHKVDSEQDANDTTILVQALDKFYRGVEGHMLYSNVDFVE